MAFICTYGREVFYYTSVPLFSKLTCPELRTREDSVTISDKIPVHLTSHYLLPKSQDSN